MSEFRTVYVCAVGAVSCLGAARALAYWSAHA